MSALLRPLGREPNSWAIESRWLPLAWRAVMQQPRRWFGWFGTVCTVCGLEWRDHPAADSNWPPIRRCFPPPPPPHQDHGEKIREVGRAAKPLFCPDCRQPLDQHSAAECARITGRYEQRERDRARTL